MRRPFYRLFLVCILALICQSAARAESSLPTVTVTSVRRIFSNGEHNAFTDLILFHHQLFLAFRSCPDGHMAHPTASVIVLRSDDAGQSWQQVDRFSVHHRDTRDPHFLILRDRLFVYTGTWYTGPNKDSVVDYDMNKLLGFAVSTSDGTHWTDPVMLDGTLGYFVWRTATFGGKAFMNGRRKADFEMEGKGEGEKAQSLMLESDDGLVWKPAALFAAHSGDETAFLFEKNGDILAVSRDGTGKNAHLLKSAPPYTQFSSVELDRLVGGPLVARWNGHTIVGGRKFLQGSDRKDARTSLCWLVNDKLQEFAELPSSGDNSYPGFVALSPTHALVSYYSSHERKPSGEPLTAIYLADLTLSP